MYRYTGIDDICWMKQKEATISNSLKWSELILLYLNISFPENSLYYLNYQYIYIQAWIISRLKLISYKTQANFIKIGNKLPRTSKAKLLTMKKKNLQEAKKM